MCNSTLQTPRGNPLASACGNSHQRTDTLPEYQSPCLHQIGRFQTRQTEQLTSYLSSQTNQNSSYEVEIGNLKKILSEINSKEQEILRKIQMQDTKSPIVD